MIPIMSGTKFVSLVLFFLIILYHQKSSSASSSLLPGSSLSVENPADILVSRNGEFTAGFLPLGNNVYSFAIWFTETQSSDAQTPNFTVVWMANRDLPVNGRRSKLLMQKSGNLLLKDAGQTVVWSTDSVSDSAAELRLLNSGNLVSTDTDGKIFWQSFNSPTDTLLPGQTLVRGAKLISSRSTTNFSSGFYQFFFDNDNVLRLLYDSAEISSIYWPDPWLLAGQAGRSIFNDSRIAVLDSFGKFSASDNVIVLASDYGTKLQRKLTLEPDGNLRQYSRKRRGGTWDITWVAVLQPCKIHGICGANSLCTYVPDFGRRCSCVPGYKIKNESDWTRGCEPDFRRSCAASMEKLSGFAYLPNVEFYGYDVGVYGNYTLEKCKSLCLGFCELCVGFHYKYDKGSGLYNCYVKSELRNGYHTPGFDGDIYLKLPKSVLSSRKFSDMATIIKAPTLEHCSPSENTVILERIYHKNHVSGLLKFMLWFAIGVGATETIVIFTVWFFVIRSRENSIFDDMQGYIQAATGFRKFSYSELKNATKGFKEVIGEGAGGTVYKAVLSDGRVAAVKQLRETNQGELEFFAEVSTIGKLNHMNLIEMWGYCAEGKHRLLVYEYMEHGSLTENLSSNVLDWSKRFEIVVGTAKGLAYLHEECLEWVLHCDVKPQNILLGADFQPKVSDFGLSKLLERSEHSQDSGFSRIRGTRGYMAPEWVYNLPITSKVDVYSYGVVVLEILTGVNPTRGIYDLGDVGEVRQKTLVSWVREKVVGGGAMSKEAWIEEIVDPAMEGQYSKREVEMLVEVALNCVEEDRGSRPTMRQVVEMLLSHENDN